MYDTEPRVPRWEVSAVAVGAVLLALFVAVILLATHVLSAAIGLTVVLVLCAALLMSLQLMFRQMRVAREVARDLEYRNRRRSI